jgi:hypothetical protein
MSGAEPTAHHTPQGSHSYVFRCIVYILYRIYTPHANQMPQCTCTTCLSAHSYQPNVTQNQCGALRHLGPGCLSGLRVPHVKSVLHGAFVCANKLNIQKRWFPARAGRAVVEPRWPRRRPSMAYILYITGALDDIHTRGGAYCTQNVRSLTL